MMRRKQSFRHLVVVHEKHDEVQAVETAGREKGASARGDCLVRARRVDWTRRCSAKCGQGRGKANLYIKVTRLPLLAVEFPEMQRHGSPPPSVEVGSP